LTYRKTDASDDADGYFMLMASPARARRPTKPSPKDIVFVADTSGSMAEKDKIGQLKKALQYCLANLNDEDRFNIVRFSTEAEPLFAELEHPNEGALKRARDFVDKFRPTGGTAIDDALTAALKRAGERTAVHRRVPDRRRADDRDDQRGRDRPPATDRAVRRPRLLLRHRPRRQHAPARPCRRRHPRREHLRAAEEDIEVKVSSFYSKVKSR
jgi:hypothetical protein